MSTKEEKWQKISEQVDQLEDKIGKPIDPGIRETVIILNAFGFSTTQSCEGHLDHAYAGPYVDIDAPDNDELKQIRSEIKRINKEENRKFEEGKKPDLEALKKMHELSDKNNKIVLPIVKTLIGLLWEFYRERNVDYDQILKIDMWPLEGARLMSQGTDIQSLDDKNLAQSYLERYQKEMKDFTEFLKNKYFEN